MSRRRALARALPLVAALALLGPAGCFGCGGWGNEHRELGNDSSCKDWYNASVRERAGYARKHNVSPYNEFKFIGNVCSGLQGPREGLTLGELISRLGGTGALR